MASNFVGCEAFFARHSAGPIYSGEWSARFEYENFDVDDPLLTAIIPFAPDQRPGIGWVAQVQGYIASDAPDRMAIWAIEGFEYWNIDGVWVDNGGIQPIRPSTNLAYGRQCIPYQLAFGGAAQTAVTALTGIGDLVVEVKYRPQRDAGGFWQDFATFGEFCNVPPNTPSTLAPAAMDEFIQTLLSTSLTNTGSRYLCGVNRYAEAASWSAIDCTGFITILPSDIGSSDNQIPSNVASNTAARFRAHPNTFFRSAGDKCRGMAVRWSDTTSVSTTFSDQPIGIYTNDDPIASSDWLVIVDGQPAIVNLVTSTLCYTPFELWNNVWAPLVQNSDSIKNAAAINGSVRMNRLSYLTYARCLTRAGTLYQQDDVIPPG